MKKILFPIIISVCMLSGCENNLYRLSSSDTDNNQVITNIQSPEFEYTKSDDHALETDIGILSSLGKISYHDGNIYLVSPGMVYRYQPETGLVTSLCDDPTCMHNNKECQFFGITTAIGGMYIYDNMVFYKQDFVYTVQEDINEEPELFKVKRYSKYDIEDRELTVLHDIGDGASVNSECFAGGYRYYLETVIGENNNVTYHISRQDLHTLKTTVIKELGNAVTGISHVDDENLYLSNGVDLYYSPLSSPEEEISIYHGNVSDSIYDDGKFYMMIKNGDKRDLYSIDRNGENLTELAQNVGYFYLTENNIYFRSNDKVTVGTTEKGEEIKAYDSTIYRLPKAGGTPEIVFTMPEDMQNYFLSYFVVDGNYLYCPYGYFDIEADRTIESYTQGVDFLRINLATGEFYRIVE